MKIETIITFWIFIPQTTHSALVPEADHKNIIAPSEAYQCRHIERRRQTPQAALNSANPRLTEFPHRIKKEAR